MKCELMTCFRDASCTISSKMDKNASAICKQHLKEFKEGSMYYILFPELFEIKTIEKTQKPICKPQTKFGEYSHEIQNYTGVKQ